jgi:uncharacterized iron-regulated protein
MKKTLSKSLWLMAITFLFSFTLKSDKPAYRMFNAKGKNATFNQLVKQAAKADIVLFGELHNNPINHWLQLELTEALHKTKGNNLILAAEMFEADNQQALSDYLAGRISDSAFKASCRLWPNYKTDYKPMVEFAKSNQLHFVAANIPRKYASLVYKKGTDALDTLSDSEKAWIAPLPFDYDSTLACYADIFKMAGGHGGQNLPKSQAIKDATMAHFILRNFEQGKTVLHFNGSYHSNNFQSIYWYLKKQNPTLKIVTIASTSQTDLKKMSAENKGLADFIIVTPENMTSTH